eukprot:CAMPEP_0116870136 /NCGR_PEP_ID=MMETSP0463-20121206/2_1 /TAXON_ID=181622 /ORGANISM="Strombidinopsis sp, Strain SopsisLIS2011" /LENGTH=254 /DNA_ID=CAMNT_0004506287 /DNA_START=26 /DNA_END=790 /DNA_ORIENTATION=+
MKTFFAALVAIAAAEGEGVMSEKTDVTLVAYATNQTEPSTTQGMMKGNYATEDDNGTMKWCWEFTVQSKANLSLTNNNYLCWYLGFPTTDDDTMNQTMAECVTYNSTDKAFNDDLTVNTYVATRSTATPTYSQMSTSTTTSYLGGTSSLVDAPWMTYMTPSIESMTNGSNQSYFQYMGKAKREFADSTGKLELSVGSSYMAYGSYYTWNSNANNQAKKDGMMGSAVEVTILEIPAGAANLATAAVLAVAATMAF